MAHCRPCSVQRRTKTSPTLTLLVRLLRIFAPTFLSTWRHFPNQRALPTPIHGRINYRASVRTAWGHSARALRAGRGRGRGMAGRSCVLVARKGISVGADAAKVCSRCRRLPPADLHERRGRGAPQHDDPHHAPNAADDGRRSTARGRAQAGDGVTASYALRIGWAQAGVRWVADPLRDGQPMCAADLRGALRWLSDRMAGT